MAKRKSDDRLDGWTILHRGTFMLVTLAAALAFTVLWVRINHTQGDLKKTADNNRDTLVYLCDTSDALATTLDRASKQIRAQIDSGFYERPEIVALIGEKAQQNAIDTASAYHQQIQLLRRAGNPCNMIQREDGDH